MAAEGDGPQNRRWGVIIGLASGVVTVLVGLNTLIGFNPLKDLTPESGKASVPPPTSSSVSVPTWTVSAAQQTYRSAPTTEVRKEATVPTRPAPPQFLVRSTQFNGPCGDSWCSMSAIFRNYGGAGTGYATFYVLLPDKDQFLARCSVVLPATSANGLTNAGCWAGSGQLLQYFRSHPGGTVRMDVKVGY